jgi:hypothetical protein
MLSFQLTFSFLFVCLLFAPLLISRSPFAALSPPCDCKHRCKIYTDPNQHPFSAAADLAATARATLWEAAAAAVEVEAGRVVLVGAVESEVAAEHHLSLVVLTDSCRFRPRRSATAAVWVRAGA